jgi:hypothetical protein
MYEVVLESFWTVIVVTALVKDDERGGQGHASASLASVCHMKPHCEHTLFLHKCFYDFVFCFVSYGWQN